MQTTKNRPQPIDFNRATSTKSEVEKKSRKIGMITGLIPEPGMPGFNKFGMKGKNNKK